MPDVDVAGFAGPLDFLVDAVRRQRVDLGAVGFVDLVDQLVAALGQDSIPLERRAEWLVLAATLVQLRASLLWPREPAEQQAAQDEASRQLSRWRELAAMCAAAAWLAARPQLGRHTFARGQPELPQPDRGQQTLAWLEATLAMLERMPNESDVELAPVYRPSALLLDRPEDARPRLLAALARDPAGGPLTAYVPREPPPAAEPLLWHRSAVASTLVAALELAKEGEAEVRHEGAAISGDMPVIRLAGSKDNPYFVSHDHQQADQQGADDDPAAGAGSLGPAGRRRAQLSHRGRPRGAHPGPARKQR